MKYFCCDSFRFRHEGKSSIGLNFRIIKLTLAFIDRSEYTGNVYRYLITEGYEMLDDKTRIIFMEFCPHCGKELKKLYRSDDYVNETNHDY